jgi:hypothetical protein
MIFRERLDNIRLEIQEYYGAINELKAHATSKVPMKPGYLEAYEMIKEMRIPLVTGGLIDQPHLWLLEYQTIDQTVKLMEALGNIVSKEPDA